MIKAARPYGRAVLRFGAVRSECAPYGQSNGAETRPKAASPKTTRPHAAAFRQQQSTALGFSDTATIKHYCPHSPTATARVVSGAAFPIPDQSSVLSGDLCTSQTTKSGTPTVMPVTTIKSTPSCE